MPVKIEDGAHYVAARPGILLDCMRCGRGFPSVIHMTDWFTMRTVHVCDECVIEIINDISNDYMVMKLIEKLHSKGAETDD